ncbi:hypothetical protein NC653_010109 [Populus alba x Populus x berolinensis]|uniref:Uncharacterized protein n=1 Tax=Populus alba x Populus x berolinensis TaxID=444605 RepID=A0AAD6W5C8_9ROSI|nr:hypothetical protein NC653_010109 [Populus alba x Populus x berolinensis]
MDGFELFVQGQLITLFSAATYWGKVNGLVVVPKLILRDVIDDKWMQSLKSKDHQPQHRVTLNLTLTKTGVHIVARVRRRGDRPPLRKKIIMEYGLFLENVSEIGYEDWLRKGKASPPQLVTMHEYSNQLHLACRDLHCARFAWRGKKRKQKIDIKQNQRRALCTSCMVREETKAKEKGGSVYLERRRRR